MTNKAFFLDRDGIINYPIFRGISPKPIAPWTIEEFNLIPGLGNILTELKKNGFYIFVVTNQPDISKGIIDIELINKMNKIILDKYPINEILFCPHTDDDNCLCRKPKPGMILSLIKKYKINVKNSYILGDNFKDIEAGKAAGLKTILLNRFYNKNYISDFKINEFSEIMNLI